MSDVVELLSRTAEQAAAQARPPALLVLRHRRARRRAARAGVGLTAVAGLAAAGVLLGQQEPAPDVVVGGARPPVTAPVPVPAGQVALPAWAARELRLPAGAPPVADEASRYATEDGPLVTAVRRDGDRSCWAVFTAGDPTGPAGGASCDPVDLPTHRSGRLDLRAASESRSSSAAVDWLVLTGSAPAGTRTVVLTASDGAQERLPVTGAGPEHLDRAFFALPWVQQDTVVEALDGSGRSLDREELLLAMGQPPG